MRKDSEYTEADGRMQTAGLMGEGADRRNYATRPGKKADRRSVARTPSTAMGEVDRIGDVQIDSIENGEFSNRPSGKERQTGQSPQTRQTGQSPQTRQTGQSPQARRTIGQTRKKARVVTTEKVLGSAYPELDNEVEGWSVVPASKKRPSKQAENPVSGKSEEKPAVSTRGNTIGNTIRKTADTVREKIADTVLGKNINWEETEQAAGQVESDIAFGAAKDVNADKPKPIRPEDDYYKPVLAETDPKPTRSAGNPKPIRSEDSPRPIRTEDSPIRTRAAGKPKPKREIGKPRSMWVSDPEDIKLKTSKSRSIWVNDPEDFEKIAVETKPKSMRTASGAKIEHSSSVYEESDSPGHNASENPGYEEADSPVKAESYNPAYTESYDTRTAEPHDTMSAESHDTIQAESYDTMTAESYDTRTAEPHVTVPAASDNPVYEDFDSTASEEFHTIEAGEEPNEQARKKSAGSDGKGLLAAISHIRIRGINVKNTSTFLLAVSAVLLILFLFLKLLPFVLPLMIAVIISFLLEPIIRQITKRIRIKRKHAATAVIVFLLIIIFLILWAVIGKLVKEFGILRDNFQDILNSVLANILSLLTTSENATNWLPSQLTLDFNTILNDVVNQLTGYVQNFVGHAASFVGQAPNAFMFIITMVLSTFFLLIDREKYVDFSISNFPRKWINGLKRVKNDMFSALFGYVRSQLIIMSILFVELVIGLLLLGVEYPYIIAFFIALFDALPVLGSSMIMIPWGLYQLATGNYFLGLGIIGLFGLCSGVRHIIEPKIMSSNIGINPLLLVTAMYVGLKWVGLGGMIIGPVSLILLKTFLSGIMQNRTFKEFFLIEEEL